MKIHLASWFLASRPKTLTAALVPVLTGAALAHHDAGSFSLAIVFFALSTAIWIQIGTNLINDALDFQRGADTSERLGPTRAAQSGLLTLGQVYSGGVICFATAMLFSIPLIVIGGWPIAALVGLSILCGYLYTGGPLPLAYVGLADLFVLLFFGFIATGAVYSLHTGEVTGSVAIAGGQVGLLTMVMLAINNLRDVDSDRKANKRTLPVRFGKGFGRLQIILTVLLPYPINLFWYLQGYYWAALLPVIAFPLALFIVRGVWQNEPGRVYNRFLGLSALHQLAFGVLLSLGFCLR